MTSDNLNTRTQSTEMQTPGGDKIVEIPTIIHPEVETTETQAENTSSVVTSPTPEAEVTVSNVSENETVASVQETAVEVSEDSKPDLVDTDILSGDKEYLGALKKVIREDADEPFREQANSEKLQKGYLKERFGVDVLIDEEEV